LARIGARRALAADQQIARIIAIAAVRRNLQMPVERATDYLRRNPDAVGCGEQSCNLVAVLHLLDEIRRAAMRADEPHQHIRIVVRPPLAHAEKLFRGARENFRHEMQDVADAEIDRDRIPGRADAERVDMLVLQTFHHVGRRQHDHADVFIRVDAAGRHPEAQVIIVRGEREGHAERQRLLALGLARRDYAGERACRYHRVTDVARGGAGNRRMQRGRDRNGIAVHAQAERRDDRHLDVTEAQARCDGDRRDQMRSIEQADIELVADIRPRDFPHQLDVEAFLRREALVHCDKQRRGVRERDESDAQPLAGHLNISDAMITDCATSAIFFFSFIAVLRSSA
jgi:hypothetical protein